MSDTKEVRLEQLGWVERKGHRTAVILWQSAAGTVGWRFQGRRREYESTVANFLKKFKQFDN